VLPDPAHILRPEADEIVSTDPPVAIPPEFSDDALAADFTIQHGPDFRYVAPWGKWLRWDGHRWAEDRTIRIFDLVREVCRGAARLPALNVARHIASAKTIAAVEKLARSDRKLATLPEAFDLDPFLLNTPGGTVDLRDGTLRPHRRNDMLRMMTRVTPDKHEDKRLWLRFLKDVTCNDLELQAYMQRLFGYCLTADTRDHVLAFFCGTGANGKSTLIETIQHVLGDYARQIPAETLMETRSERHPTEIANLMGVRLAAVSEVEEGHHWAEARIKALTGDDVLAARFMRQDFFTFRRSHKLIVLGNHKPAIRAVDEAIRRRIHLVPFKARFVGNSADRDMPRKLQAIGSAVFAWAIEGCLEWQRRGLEPPASIVAATKDYLDTQDTLGLWLDECCSTADRYAKARSSLLYEHFRQWKDARGERAPSQVRFSAQLEERFEKGRDSQNSVVFLGLSLKS